MSKIDEAKLNQAMKTIADYFQSVSELSLKCHQQISEVFTTGTVTEEKFHQGDKVIRANPAGPEPPTPQPSFWVTKEGQQGPFEMLKFMDTEEYRMLRAETERADHPIRQTFNGKPYTVWLMRDGETIGRKALKVKS